MSPQIDWKLSVFPKNTNRLTRFFIKTIKNRNLKLWFAYVAFLQALKWHKVEFSIILCSVNTTFGIIPQTDKKHISVNQRFIENY